MVEDQDFFFDEESDNKPSKPAPKAKPAGGAKKAAPAKAAPAKAAATPASSDAPMYLQTVTMGIAGLLAVCALLVGVIVGMFIPRGGATESLGTAGTITAPQGGGGTAQPLTPDQLNNGELPAGHPNIGGNTTGSAGATGSKAATGVK